MKQIENGNFEEVIQNNKLCVVDFFATWCGPCKMLSPVIDGVSEEYAGKVDFYKVDIDGNQDLAMKYGVEAVPTVVFMKQGKVVDKFVGFHDADSIKQMVEKSM
ncbi:MAG: thioredoxin [Clostridia bacterium]